MSVKSSNSDNQNHERYQQFPPYQTCKTKKSKDYVCPCGRSYGSYPALYSHIKQKHGGNAPGQVIKPKPHRRRGRPYKYEPVNLQYQNAHRNASKHLEDYLRVPPNDQLNQFPLKEFANQDLSKINFINNNDEQQYLRYQYFIRNNPNRQNQWIKEDEKLQQVNQFQKQLNAQFIMGQDLLCENQYSFAGNEQSFDVRQMNFDDRRNQYKTPFINQMTNFHQLKGIQETRSMNNTGIRNQSMMMQRSRRLPYHQQQYDRPDVLFESIYCKPYELELKEEIQDKFSPIALGISQFLQPILRQLIVSQQSAMTSREMMNRVNDEHLKQVVNKNKEVIEIIEDSNEEGRQEDVNINANNLNITTNNSDKVGSATRELTTQQQVVNHNIINNDNIVEKRQIQCRQLLQNDHLRDIVRWLMYPPQQLSNPMCKQNYIENSFRCCLVQFLDFTNQFLQRVQHQQLLLVLVFFCDHILAATGSFQNKPQPLVYEMFMYFNSFLYQYLPKLIAFMPILQKLFIFNDYKKKISELFMWMSTWQAIQQYYHNRCFRQKVLYELQQESLKSLQYQEKYNMYINQAQRQSMFGQVINTNGNNNGNNNNNGYPLLQEQQQFMRDYQLTEQQLQHQQQQQQLPQQKTEQNPQQIQFNPLYVDGYFDNQHRLADIPVVNQFENPTNNNNNNNTQILQQRQVQNGRQFVTQHVELHEIHQVPQQEHNDNIQQYNQQQQPQQQQLLRTQLQSCQQLQQHHPFNPATEANQTQYINHQQ